MKKLLFIVVFYHFFSFCNAQNPIVPPGVYIADPSAHVWGDGKLYVYGSRDESPNYYCSWNYHVLSTSDLKTWIIHENAFASKGPGDQVPYSDDFLYAPDVQYKNGRYYLYYCLANNTRTEGVATSGSPAGPFMKGKPIRTGGINEIDPCVFIDDDGQAYYIWGQFSAKMAKLKPNMTEIDSSTIRDNIVTEKEHRFHEGGYMVKRNGVYYFVYAGLSISDMASCICYATSNSPWGPFKYGGIIINNDHSDPGNWNNHGSLVEFNGQWYVFYHRATHGSYTMRKACLEPITFNEDGSINEAEMTTQGAALPLNALQQMDAERACLLHGNLRIQAFTADNEELTGIREGDRAAYKYLDFGKGVKSVSVRVAPGADPGTITIGLDKPWGWAIGTAEVPGNGDGKTWTTISVKVEPVTGVHAVWLRFNAKGENSFKVDWFRFDDKTNAVKTNYTSVYQVQSGKPVTMVTTAYNTTLIADGKDSTRIRVSVIDSTGREITDSDISFQVYITGNATITGTENGPEITYHAGEYGAGFWEGNLVNGSCQLIFRSGTKPDKIKVEVKSPGLGSGSHEIHTLPANIVLLKPDSSQLKPSQKVVDRMLGADVSFLPELEASGMKFFDKGEQKDLLDILRDHGFNYIRLRIFVNPENEKGYSPGKGFCGFDSTLKMASRVKKAGMKLSLDFHYSDYWADPQQQYKPLAWEDLDFEMLKDTLKEYTKDVLLALKKQGTLPEMVQIGNEINHGMLWPDGYIGNPDNLAQLIKAGLEGVREVDPCIITMMHIALGGQHAEAVFWLDNMIARGVEFDILGLSFYPRWHGTLDDLALNLKDLAKRYQKYINVVEYSQYKKEVNDIVYRLPDNLGKGTCIWEPVNFFEAVISRDGHVNSMMNDFDMIRDKHFK